MLIGLAHGSRHTRVAEGVEAVLAAVTDQTGVPTRAAYLDLTDPDLEALAGELAAAGVRRAVVVPLLFTDAFHARIDVPDAVTRAAESSGVELVLGPILGTDDDVVDVVAARLAASGTPSDAPILLYAVGSSRPEANAAVAGLADRLAARRGTVVRVGFGTTEPRATDCAGRARRRRRPAGDPGPAVRGARAAAGHDRPGGRGCRLVAGRPARTAARARGGRPLPRGPGCGGSAPLALGPCLVPMVAPPAPRSPAS